MKAYYIQFIYPQIMPATITVVAEDEAKAREKLTNMLAEYSTSKFEIMDVVDMDEVESLRARAQEILANHKNIEDAEVMNTEDVKIVN